MLPSNFHASGVTPSFEPYKIKRYDLHTFQFSQTKKFTDLRNTCFCIMFFAFYIQRITDPSCTTFPLANDLKICKICS